jgi:hypothetical protein
VPITHKDGDTGKKNGGKKYLPKLYLSINYKWMSADLARGTCQTPVFSGTV